MITQVTRLNLSFESERKIQFSRKENDNWSIFGKWRKCFHCFQIKVAFGPIYLLFLIILNFFSHFGFATIT